MPLEYNENCLSTHIGSLDLLYEHMQHVGRAPARSDERDDLADSNSSSRYVTLFVGLTFGHHFNLGGGSLLSSFLDIIKVCSEVDFAFHVCQNDFCLDGTIRRKF